MSENKQCKYEGCDYECMKSNKYCLFHKPDKSEREAREFYGKLKKQKGVKKEAIEKWGTKINRLIFKKAVNWEGYKFPEIPKDQETGERVFSFDYSLFSNMANLENAKFEGEVNFRGAEFFDIAHFEGATFERMANFNGTKFRKIAMFQRVKFRERPVFACTKFKKGSNFERAKFKKGSFQRAKFKGSAIFIGAEFKSYIAFHYVDFRKNVSFRGANFKGEVNFLHTNFKGKVNFEATKFKERGFFYYTNFRSGASFNDTEFRKAPDLTGAKFSSLEDSNIAFHLAREMWEREGNRNKADYHFYREMVAKRRSRWPELFIPKIQINWKLFESKKEVLMFILRVMGFIPSKIVRLIQLRLKPIFINFLELILVDFTCSYGASWLKVLRAWGFTILFSALIFWLGGGIITKDGIPIKSFWQSLYFSIVTFTTLGYGDYSPKPGFFQVLASAEALIGAFLMALFIAVFARKWMRR